VSERASDASAFHLSGRAEALALGLTLVGAVAVRAYPLLRAGGAWEYPIDFDEGVYFSAASLVWRGVLPYRDFVFVHPPGILWALAPSGIMSGALGPDTAFVFARWFAVILGAANALLVALIARRWAGPSAGVCAALVSYFVTSNSDGTGPTFNRVTNIEESAVKMSADLTTVQSVFTVANYQALDQTDFDFGAGGLLLLPPQGNLLLPNLAAAAGKDGNLYLLNADRLKQSFFVAQIDGCWCAPSYFEGSDGVGRIVTSGGMTVRVWTVTGRRRPTLTLENTSGGIANGQDAGFFTSVSSSGTAPGTAIVWAVGRPTDSNPAHVSLYAINADTGQRLFTAVAGQWPNSNSNSNIVPVVANGRVYVASNQTVTIFGLGGSSDVALPKIQYVDMRPPLAPGQHEIYGTIEGGTDSAIVVRRRGGEEVRVVDITNAARKFRLTTPVIGNALIARGTYDRDGVLHADVVLRAKKNPKLWPADR